MHYTSDKIKLQPPGRAARLGLASEGAIHGHVPLVDSNAESPQDGVHRGVVCERVLHPAQRRRAEQVSPNRPTMVPTNQKKPAGKPVKPAGSVGIKKYRHGLGLGTGPVPPGTGRTGPVPNGSGNPGGEHQHQRVWPLRTASWLRSHLAVDTARRAEYSSLHSPECRIWPPDPRPRENRWGGRACRGTRSAWHGARVGGIGGRSTGNWKPVLVHRARGRRKRGKDIG
jgi:hypothetical protein